jgi:4-aminobutyrate aminotransferase
MSGTDFYYPHMAELAERLAKSFPGPGEKKVYFGNSGTEAIEAALKLARYATGRDKFIAFHGCFHGRTMGALSLTSSKLAQRRRFGPLIPGVYHAPFGDAACIENQLFRALVPPEEVAAIVVEPIQGEGGYLIPPHSFLQELRAICDRHGILLVADEVQSGCGRTGKMWAIEHAEVIPDILCSAKGIASGLPLGATIARAGIMTWKPGAHASTFGGNPVCIAAALATLDLLESELMANAAAVGAYLLDRISAWPARHKSVKAVRGRGLMVAIELDDHDARDRLVQAAFQRGLLILGAGDAALRLMPPLVVTREQASFALDVIEECLSTTDEHR